MKCEPLGQPVSHRVESASPNSTEHPGFRSRRLHRRCQFSAAAPPGPVSATDATMAG
jgi:hypothetical protein